MTKFEEELKKNNFVCTKCAKCRHWVWPPSEYCDKCWGDTTWEQVSRNAKIVEASSKDGKNFCIAEFENGIRVFGDISGQTKLAASQSLILEYCTFDNAPKFVFRANVAK